MQTYTLMAMLKYYADVEKIMMLQFCITYTLAFDTNVHLLTRHFSESWSIESLDIFTVFVEVLNLII